MLRCPLCHRVFAAHKERCPRHSTLEPTEAVRLDEALASRTTPLSLAELAALLDAIARLDDDARLLLSPKRLWVAPRADALVLVGIEGDPLIDALDDALHDPLDATKATLSARRAYRLAAITHELLANEPAFSAKNAKAVEVRKRLEAPPSLTAARADVPSELAALVAKALDRREINALDEGSFVRELRARCAAPAPAPIELAFGAAPVAMGAPAPMAPMPMARAAMAPAPMAMSEPMAAPARSRSAWPVVLLVVAVVALAFVGAAVLSLRGGAEKRSPSAMLRTHEGAHDVPLADGRPAQQAATATTATTQPPIPIGVTNTTPIPERPTTAPDAPTPSPIAPTPTATRTQNRRVRSSTTGQAVPRAARLVAQRDEASQPPTREAAATTSTAAPTSVPQPSGRRTRVSTRAPSGEPTTNDTRATSAVVAQDASAPMPTEPREIAPELTRSAPTHVEEAPRSEPPTRVEAPARSSSTYWVIGALAAVAAAASALAYLALRAKATKATNATPSNDGAPVASSAAAPPAELVATRVSAVGTIHSTLHATVPASASAPVDALARTEVGAMIGAASLRSRPGDSNTRPQFQPFAIGAYECVEQLGEGAMGIVYKARHEKLKRWCAVKVLVPDLAEKPDAAMQFRREAELAASVQHPNTVVVYDFGELEGGLLYLVMELLEGKSMDSVLREKKLAASEALELTRQLCAGLDALHGAGIIHQDLKPQNVMVIEPQSASPVVKIVDFGLARLAGADPIESPSGGRRISGTPLYMAPEQARADDQITPSADLFALAVVAYELLSGTAPFEIDGRTVSQVVLERASGQFHPRTIGFAVGDSHKAQALDALFTDALAVEPAQRPRSAGEFYSRMQGALAA